MVKITRDNIYLHLLEKQFNLVDKTIQDALLDKNWPEWTVSPEQFEKFRKYAIPLIRKTFKINKKKTEEIFEWFKTNHSLKIRKL